jgi:hypothetical protein
MIEQAIAGLVTINTWTGNAHTLTTANGTTSESRCAMLVAATGGGAPTAAAEIICPAAAKLYVLQNNTSFAVTLKTSAGTGVAVAAGNTAFLFCDGTNVNSCVTTIVDGNITGNLTVGGNATINGNTTLGNATSDTITATARFNTDLVPSTDNARDLGSVANSWKDLYIDGTAYLALVDINGGTIDGVSIGATTAATLINVDNLRLDGNTISSTDTNGNIVIAPNGTGDVQLDADTVRVGDSGAAATLTSNGAGALTVTTGGAADLTLSTNSGTTSGTVVIANGANGNITLTPDGTGDVILSADRVQIGDSNTDTTLTTNGTGSLNLTTNNGTNSGTIQIAQGVNGNITLTPNGTGSVSVPKLVWSNGTATRVPYLTTGGQFTDSANLTFNGTDLTVSGAVNAGSINATTLDLTNLEVTNIKAKDGTAAMTIADSTGVVSFTANPILSGGTANGVLYLNGSKVATSGSALTYNETTLSVTAEARIKAASSGDQIRIEPGTAGAGVSLLSRNSADTILAPMLSYGSYHTWYVDGGARGMDLTTTGLGIGTANPQSKLHIQSALGTAETLITLQSGYSSPSGNKSIAWTDGSGRIGAIGVNYTAPQGAMTFGSLYNSGYNTTDLMVLTPAVLYTVDQINVGFGSASPTDHLELVRGLATTGTGINTPNGLTLQNTNATVGNYTTIQNKDSTGAQNTQIQFINVTQGTNFQGAIAFCTRVSVGNFGERGRFTPTGTLLVGYTSGNEVTNIETPSISIGQTGTASTTAKVRFAPAQAGYNVMSIYNSGSVSGGGLTFVTGDNTTNSSNAALMVLHAGGVLSLGTTSASTGIDTGNSLMYVVAPNSNYGAAITAVADSQGRTIRFANQAKNVVGALDSSDTSINIGSNSSHPLLFSTSGIERGRFGTNGNFGVGVGANNANTKLELRTDTLTLGSEPNITLYNRGTATTSTTAYSIGGVYGAAFRDVRDPGYVAGMEFFRDSASAGLNSQGSIRFYAAPDAGTLAELRASWERMRLEPSGNLLVGTTSTSGSAANTARIVGGIINSAGTSALTFTNGTATTIFTLSDIQDGQTWIVCADVAGQSNQSYACVYIVTANYSGSAAATQLVKGSLASISVSGLNVQYTQSSGGTQTSVKWNAIRIS